MTTKEMIVEVAKKEFITKGYTNTTLRKVASKCNITATAIYRHFQDKEQIFQTIIQPFIDKLNKVSKEIEQVDYDLLFKNNVEQVWAFEEERNIHFELLFTDHRPIVMLVIKERREWLKNILLECEFTATMRYLNKMRELGYKLKDFDELSYKAILDSYLEAYIHVLEMNLNKQDSYNICKTISEFYRVGFRQLLGF
jgi:AcrR family transcriptional regulator